MKRVTDSTTAVACVVQTQGLYAKSAGRTLLHDINLQLHAGELTALIGPNGAGKSSLIRAISGEWPVRGALNLFGRARSNWSARLLAQRVAVMPQQSTLSFDFTVRDIIAMGRLPHPHVPQAHNAAHVEVLLDELGLRAMASRLFTTLSGGERQRVQFARALAQISGEEKHGLLLLDEPTAALDLAQQAAMLALTRRRVAAGACVLAVVHDLNLAARNADRILVMQQGRLIADGSVDTIYRAPLLGAAFGVAVHVERTVCDGAPVVIARGA